MNFPPLKKVLSRLLLPAVAAAALDGAADEPVRWSDGTWDLAGAPKGALLSDNDGWWGRSVFTGVEYSYAQAPASPGDRLRGDKAHFGRRLLDGDVPTGWHRPVGMSAKKPIVVTFDFKRPCRFSEVTVLSDRTREASAAVEVSADGEVWRDMATADCCGSRSRIRPENPGRGRYLRLSFKAKSANVTYLDEVLVWGEGEVSTAFPENIVPVRRGDALKMSAARTGKLRIFPLADPAAGSAVKTGMPPMSFAEDRAAAREIVMARNETEIRYYAVVNETDRAKRVAVSVSGFGGGVEARLCIGGMVRTSPPKYKLTEKQRFDLQLAGTEPDGAFGADKLDVLPFFAAGELPPENVALKYLANPEQVAGFPGAVEIRPGEGAVLMLRLKTADAAPGALSGAIKAGDCRFRVPVKVLDITLPAAPPWVFVWGRLTDQFPFESRSRIRNDVSRFLGLGAVVVNGLPEKGSKAEIFAEAAGCSNLYYRVFGGDRKLVDKTYKGGAALSDEDRTGIDRRLAEIRARASACGVEPGRIILEISDEPGERNAAVFGEVCRYFRKRAPDMLVYMNPCFWTGKGFSASGDIIAALKGYYNECVDVSVPYRSLVEDDNARKTLWTARRTVNAQYAHPAHRAGRSIAWSSFRYGMDGFGYWSYYSPTGNPWDIRTWKYWSYECQLVFPLENSVAVTPVYEEMREAREDWLLLSLLREKGKTAELRLLLNEFAASFDEANRETARPYRCDFAKLRLKALYAASDRRNGRKQ